MESIYSSLLELTRVDGTIRPYRYFSNHDDKVVTLGPREVEFGTAKQPDTGLFKVISDKLIEMVPTSGKFAALWECTILDESGRVCCNSVRYGWVVCEVWAVCKS